MARHRLELSDEELMAAVSNDPAGCPFCTARGYTEYATDFRAGKLQSNVSFVCHEGGCGRTWCVTLGVTRVTNE